MVPQQLHIVSGATVTDASNFFAWNAAASGDIITAPGLWSLDNFGNKLIATINDGESFEWNSNPTGATSTRATIITGAPTASAFSLVSTPDRHLVFFWNRNNYRNFNYTRSYVCKIFFSRRY